MADIDLNSNELPERNVDRLLLRFESRFYAGDPAPDFNILFEVEDTAAWIVKFRGGSVIVNNRENIFAGAADTSNVISFKTHRDFTSAISLSCPLQDCKNKTPIRVEGSERAATYFWENFVVNRVGSSSIHGSGSSESFGLVSWPSNSSLPSQSPFRSTETKRTSITGLNFQRVGKPFLLRPQAAADPSRQVIKSGSLLKKRDILTGWQSRYFVLQLGRVEYYTDENDQRNGGRPRGVVDLVGGEVSSPKSCMVNGVEHWSITVEPKSRHRTFKVASEGLGGQGREEIIVWERFFRQAVAAPATPLTARIPSAGNSDRNINGSGSPTSSGALTDRSGGFINRRSSFDVPTTSPDTLAGRMDRVAMSERTSGNMRDTYLSYTTTGGGDDNLGVRQSRASSLPSNTAAGDDMRESMSGRASRSHTDTFDPAVDGIALGGDPIASGSGSGSGSSSNRGVTFDIGRDNTSARARSELQRADSLPVDQNPAEAAAAANQEGVAAVPSSSSSRKMAIFEAVRDREYVSGIILEFVEAVFGTVSEVSPSNISFGIAASIAIVSGYLSIGIWGCVWTTALMVCINLVMPSKREVAVPAQGLDPSTRFGTASAKSSVSDAMHAAVARDLSPTNTVTLNRRFFTEPPPEADTDTTSGAATAATSGRGGGGSGRYSDGQDDNRIIHRPPTDYDSASARPAR